MVDSKRIFMGAINVELSAKMFKSNKVSFLYCLDRIPLGTGEKIRGVDDFELKKLELTTFDYFVV